MFKDLKVIFMGTPEFAVPILEMLIEETNVVLVVTKPDKPVGRHHTLTKSPIKELALKNGIKVITPEKIRKDYTEVLNTPCDIIITCAYGQIIPKEILDYPRLSCINVHASLLPKYRGGAPIHWALINGEETTGITIMYMDELMDNGDIIKQEAIKITKEDTTKTLHTKLSKLGTSLLKNTLPSIINKTNARIKQDEKEVTFAYNIKRSDEHLDFSLTGKEILNKIRGLNSWPLANFILNNEEYKVLEAYFEPQKVTTSGIIIDIKKDAIGISCQNGVVYLTKIKPFGKKIMLTKDYLNGVKKENLLNQKVS